MKTVKDRSDLFTGGQRVPPAPIQAQGGIEKGYRTPPPLPGKVDEGYRVPPPPSPPATQTPSLGQETGDGSAKE